MIDRAASLPQALGQLKFGFYTFASNINLFPRSGGQAQPLVTIADANSYSGGKTAQAAQLASYYKFLKDSVDKVEINYKHDGSVFHNAIPALVTAIKNDKYGNGATAALPKVSVIFITDGMEDFRDLGDTPCVQAYYDNSSNSMYPTALRGQTVIDKATGTPACFPRQTQEYNAYWTPENQYPPYLYGTDPISGAGASTPIQGLDPELCDKIKSLNISGTASVELYVLQVEYYIPDLTKIRTT